MSRSGYTEYDDSDNANWNYIRWRGAITSAIRGKRGQTFLKEMLAALDAMPEKRLITDALERPEDDEWLGGVCALGAVGQARGMDMKDIDPDCYEDVAGEFGLPQSLAQEIMNINDDCGPHDETPEQRFERVRRWIERQIKKETP